MFTGLVRSLGNVVSVQRFGKGARFTVNLGALRENIEVGQSVAVNGACLTATSIAGECAAFDAVAETVSRTNLGALKPNDKVNLEPALRVGDALDGHYVLGHIDAVAPVVAVDARNPDDRRIEIRLPESIRHLVAEKGSVAVDGISLTVASVGDATFSIAIIPHSWVNSTLGLRKIGDAVNLEADVLARYAARILDFRSAAPQQPDRPAAITEDFLRKNGFA